MMDDLLRYEEIHHQIKELTEEKKALAEKIKNSLIEQNADETPPLQSGKINLVSRKKWTYSSVVDSLEENIKSVKKQEEHDNIATYEEKQEIRYMNM